jgi:hypothetical protein
MFAISMYKCKCPVVYVPMLISSFVEKLNAWKHNLVFIKNYLVLLHASLVSKLRKSSMNSVC